MSFIPEPDYERMNRLVQSVADVLFAPAADKDFKRKCEAWIKAVVTKISLGWDFGFLQSVHYDTLVAGVGVFRLEGDCNKVHAVFAPGRLRRYSLVDSAASAAGHSFSHIGVPEAYALESGNQLHLLPPPADDTSVAVVYSRPIDVSIVPDSWEPVIVDGVIGLYGRHYDRAALNEGSSEFERRFRREVRWLRRECGDAVVMDAVALRCAMTNEALAAPVVQVAVVEPVDDGVESDSVSYPLTVG